MEAEAIGYFIGQCIGQALVVLLGLFFLGVLLSPLYAGASGDA